MSIKTINEPAEMIICYTDSFQGTEEYKEASVRSWCPNSGHLVRVEHKDDKKFLKVRTPFYSDFAKIIREASTSSDDGVFSIVLKADTYRLALFTVKFLETSDFSLMAGDLSGSVVENKFELLYLEAEYADLGQ